MARTPAHLSKSTVRAVKPIFCFAVEVFGPRASQTNLLYLRYGSIVRHVSPKKTLPVVEHFGLLNAHVDPLPNGKDAIIYLGKFRHIREVGKAGNNVSKVSNRGCELTLSDTGTTTRTRNIYTPNRQAPKMLKSVPLSHFASVHASQQMEH